MISYFSASALSAPPPILNPLHLRCLILSHNSLTTFAPLAPCHNLLELSLSSNHITAVPAANFFANLTQLRILRLDHNNISDWRSTLDLQESPSLAYLTLFENPFSKNEKYRPFIVNLVPTLLALDSHVTTDEELIQSASFPNTKYTACHPTMLLPRHVIDRKFSTPFDRYGDLISDERQIQYMSTCLMSISWIHRLTSPVITIQKNYRSYVEGQRRTVILNLAATVIQRRLMYLLYQVRLQKDLDGLLVERGFAKLLVSAKEGRQLLSSIVIQAKWREVFMKKKEANAVKTIWKWFERKQENFRRLLAKMGTGKHVLMFQETDKANIMQCAVEVIKQVKGLNASVPDADSKARSIAHKHFSTSNVVVVRRFTTASIIDEDCVTDGLFRLQPRLEGQGARVKVCRGYVENRKYENKLVRYVDGSKARAAKDNRLTVVEWSACQHPSAFPQRPVPPSKSLLQQYGADNLSPIILAETVRLIHRKFPQVKVLFLAQVTRSASAVIVQSVFRSYLGRRELDACLLFSVARLRAARYVQRWYRARLYYWRRVRQIGTVSGMVKAVSSKTVYLEADLFWLLRDGESGGRVKEVLREGARKRGCGYFDNHFTFHENEVYLTEQVEGNFPKPSAASTHSLSPKHKRGKVDAVTFKTRKQLQRSRKEKMNASIARVIPCEPFPNWLPFKPDVIVESDPADNSVVHHTDIVGALLSTGASLHLVTSGNVVTNPDEEGEKSHVVVPEGVMLMSITFKDVAEARKRVGLLGLLTFDAERERSVPVFDFQMLRRVVEGGGAKQVPVIPSDWMRGFRELTPGARLQLEIMCQMHTNEIQPISFLLGGATKLPEEAAKPKRRPASSGGVRKKPAASVRKEVSSSAWLIPGASPDLLIIYSEADVTRRPATAQPTVNRSPRSNSSNYMVAGRASTPTSKTRGPQKKNNFVADAEYQAQLVRLESLITKKQRLYKEKKESEVRRKKVAEERSTKKEQVEGRRERKYNRLSVVNEMKVIKYRHDRKKLLSQGAEVKEEKYLDRQDKVWERRDGAIKNQEKIRRDKEMELMNNAMKVMADKMAINADMSKKAARKEQEAEMQRGEVLKEKLLERKGEGKGLQERGFGLKLSMINRTSGKVGRDKMRERLEREKRAEVRARKELSGVNRGKKMQEVREKHKKVQQGVREAKEKLAEDLIMREIVERENQLKRKMLYGGGGSAEEGSGETGSLCVEVGGGEGGNGGMEVKGGRGVRTASDAMMDTAMRMDSQNDVFNWNME